MFYKGFYLRAATIQGWLLIKEIRYMKTFRTSHGTFLISQFSPEVSPPKINYSSTTLQSPHKNNNINKVDNPKGISQENFSTSAFTSTFESLIRKYVYGEGLLTWYMWTPRPQKTRVGRLRTGLLWVKVQKGPAFQSGGYVTLYFGNCNSSVLFFGRNWQ